MMVMVLEQKPPAGTRSSKSRIAPRASLHKVVGGGGGGGRWCSRAHEAPELSLPPSPGPSALLRPVSPMRQGLSQLRPLLALSMATPKARRYRHPPGQAHSPWSPAATLAPSMARGRL